MKGGNTKTPHKKSGFTIIEVMIFLAVSGFTFIIAAAFINGKVAQGEYFQGMNNANATVQSIINDVANGNYPQPSSGSLGNVCAGDQGLGAVSSTPVGYSGCTYAGMVLVPSAKSVNYTVYSLAGCQYIACVTSLNSLPPASFSEENPQIITKMTENKEWSGGLYVYTPKGAPISIVNGAGASSGTTGAIGFFGALPSNSGGILRSGAQPVQVVIFPHTYVGDFNVHVIASDITPLPVNDYIVMCFDGLGGKNGKQGSLTIGGKNAGGQLNITEGMGNETAKQC